MNVYVYINNGTINEAAANALLYPTQCRIEFPMPELPVNYDVNDDVHDDVHYYINDDVHDNVIISMMMSIREGLTRKKKKCEISHLGGWGQDKIGSFSHKFHTF